jgi:hypothetical protein
MHPEFDIGDCGTGTYETYETNVTYGTGTWDWDYGTLALGFAGLFDRKITSKPNRKFIDFVLKTHVTCIFMADVEISPNGARHTKPRASGPKDRAALGGHEKEFGALTGRDISLDDAAHTTILLFSRTKSHPIFSHFRTQNPCDMHPEFDIGDCGTGTYETYETNVTHGTGTWDWDYGT